MKEIKQCPLKKEKCAYRTSRMSTLSGCSLYDNVNLCTKCTKYRKRQGEHTIKELYIFAINNSLLDEEVSIVVSKYHEKESKVIQPVKSLDLNKVEYTFDDLIALFT